MSCGLQRACASANTGTSKSGVPTYKIRSRQESSIHSLRLEAVTGAAGTVCRRENAGTCCMNSRAKSSVKQEENQSALCRRSQQHAMLRARNLRLRREKLSNFMNKTQMGELKEHEQERDFFCVVRDAFRVFAQRSSVM